MRALWMDVWLDGGTTFEAMTTICDYRRLLCRRVRGDDDDLRLPKASMPSLLAPSPMLTEKQSPGPAIVHELRVATRNNNTTYWY